MKNGLGQSGIEKLRAGIPGFDLISLGGLPKGRTTLVAGTAGRPRPLWLLNSLLRG